MLLGAERVRDEEGARQRSGGTGRRTRRPRRTRRSRRPIPILLTAAAVVAAAVVVLTRASGGSGAAGPTGSIPRFGVPAGYHIVYEIRGPGQAPSTEELWVRRPLESVDASGSGAPGTSPVLTTVTRLGREVLHANGSQPTVLSVPVAPPPVDVRLDGIVGAAVRSGRLALEGRAVVAGRACRVLRSARSLRAGPLSVPSSDDTYVDTCVDADGLVLDERTVRAGRLVSDRRAVEVAVGAAAASGGDYGLSGAVTPEDQGGGAISALTPGSLPPGRSWVLAQPPAGFEPVGRYAVEPPQPDAFAQGGSGPLGGAPAGSLVVAIDDVYMRGPDVIVIEEGETMNGARFAPATGGETVDLGYLGRGQLILSAVGTTLSAEPSNRTRFVRITGTVGPEELIAVARSLRPVDEKTSTLVRVPGAVS